LLFSGLKIVLFATNINGVVLCTGRGDPHRCIHKKTISQRAVSRQSLELEKTRLRRPAVIKSLPIRSLSGTKTERKGLREALSHLRAGDTLVVWRLDRLGRSLRDLIDAITHLGSREVGFKSLQENIDTTTSGGKLIFHIFGSMAEFERDIIRERTLAGLDAARKRGRSGGRPKALERVMNSIRNGL
jgi:DNA invertase Pin-like site-specific DNA recombinase